MRPHILEAPARFGAGRCEGLILTSFRFGRSPCEGGSVTAMTDVINALVAQRTATRVQRRQMLELREGRMM
jgi:hypothetical protein